ncbi:aminoglycoside phosphotransferase family protein [Agrobacterium sp. BA1120]|uniref:aminoglycoside phosphotransferase family protein n=1 Tax=Agrobacterium sp. BA1120 TaxID=3228927 RepID=UPI00336A6304
MRLESGAAAILKWLKPRGIGELLGMVFLEWRNGTRVVRMLEREGPICLVEDAGDLTLRDYRLTHGEAASNAIVADISYKGCSRRGQTCLEARACRPFYLLVSGRCSST